MFKVTLKIPAWKISYPHSKRRLKQYFPKSLLSVKKLGSSWEFPHPDFALQASSKDQDTVVTAASFCFPSASMEEGEKSIHQTEDTAHNTDWLKNSLSRLQKWGNKIFQSKFINFQILKSKAGWPNLCLPRSIRVLHGQQVKKRYDLTVFSYHIYLFINNIDHIYPLPNCKVPRRGWKDRRPGPSASERTRETHRKYIPGVVFHASSPVPQGPHSLTTSALGKSYTVNTQQRRELFLPQKPLQCYMLIRKSSHPTAWFLILRAIWRVIQGRLQGQVCQRKTTT